MLGAKDIIIKLKTDNKQFKGQMAGASTSMKSFAATTTASTATAASATKAMSISMVASLALATAGITVIIAGVMAFVGALKFAVTGAQANADVTVQTTALLEKQGVAWENVSEKVLDHLDALEAATGFDDTALQESFNTFIASGMSVDEALQAVDAIVALTASDVMTLKEAQKAVNKEFTTGTSRLKEYGIEGKNFDDIMSQVNETYGDGSQRAETFKGKMDILKQTFGDQLEVLGEGLLPVINGLLDALIWGAKYILPPVIYAFKILLLPIKSLVVGFKQLYEAAMAGWAALQGDFITAEMHLKNIGALQKEFNQEMINTVTGAKAYTEELEKQANVPLGNGAVGSGAVGIGTSEDSIFMQNLERYQSLQDRGVTAEEYSGGKFDTWMEVQKSEFKILQMALDKGEIDKYGNKLTEDAIETQTNLIKSGSDNTLVELQLHTGLLEKILAKIGRSGRTIYRTSSVDDPVDDLVNDIDQEQFEATAEKYKTKIPYERKSGKWTISYPGNSGAP